MFIDNAKPCFLLSHHFLLLLKELRDRWKAGGKVKTCHAALGGLTSLEKQPCVHNILSQPLVSPIALHLFSDTESMKDPCRFPHGVSVVVFGDLLANKVYSSVCGGGNVTAY